MALFECGGSPMQKTTLWAFSGNLSSDSFAAQDIPLSESIDNFKYIGIDYAYPITNPVLTVMMSVEDFKKTESGNNKEQLSFGWTTGVGTAGGRRFSYVNSTTIHADNAMAGTNTTNTSGIPQHVYGIK